MNTLTFFWAVEAEILRLNRAIKVRDQIIAEWKRRGISRDGKPGQSSGFFGGELNVVHKPLHQSSNVTQCKGEHIVSKNAISAKSIKFYCLVPKITRGQVEGQEVKSTFHSPGEGEVLTYSIDAGATGTLSVSIGSTTYIYKLTEIVGRIEVAV